jgi:uncharacterized membrane-anchored protein
MTGKNLKEVYMYVLASLLFVGFFIILGLLLTHSIPEQNKELVHTLLGVLGTCFVMTITYFFGSSKGSADKTEMMNKQ